MEDQNKNSKHVSKEKQVIPWNKAVLPKLPTVF